MGVEVPVELRKIVYPGAFLTGSCEQSMVLGIKAGSSGRGASSLKLLAIS